jgi:hypothetical protein
MKNQLTGSIFDMGKHRENGYLISVPFSLIMASRLKIETSFMWGNNETSHSTVYDKPGRPFCIEETIRGYREKWL